MGIFYNGRKVCLFILVVVHLRYLPSLDGKLERFATKKWTKQLPNSSQTDYSIWQWRLVKMNVAQRLPKIAVFWDQLSTIVCLTAFSTFFVTKRSSEITQCKRL